MSIDKNQRLGFGRYGKTAYGREVYSRGQQERKELREVNISETKKQLLATGEINRIIATIGGGKEATVLLVENSDNELVCAKVFRYFTSTIKKRLRGTKHILPDEMAILAAKQEYWNLCEMNKCVLVPKPKSLIDNIVIMDFIADKTGSNIPAPLLKDVDLTIHDPEDILLDSIDLIANLFVKGHFVHGDYSEHNLMLTKEGTLFTMDVSQSVQFNSKTFTDTPKRIRIDRAVNLLETDIRNVNQYFRRVYQISINPEEVKDSIIKELPQKLRNFLNEKTQEIYPSEMLTSETLYGKNMYRNENMLQRTGRRRQKPK